MNRLAVFGIRRVAKQSTFHVQHEQTRSEIGLVLGISESFQQHGSCPTFAGQSADRRTRRFSPLADGHCLATIISSLALLGPSLRRPLRQARPRATALGAYDHRTNALERETTINSM